MSTGTVVLRPVQQDDLALLDGWRNDREHLSEYDDFLALHRPKSRMLERWQLNGLLGEDEGMMLICRDGEPVGAMQWFQVSYGPNQGSRALNLGITVQPSSRGRGIGTQAHRLLVDYLFAQTLVHRIEASTDVTNRAEQRALERSGFSREGVQRGAQFRSGQWHDLVLYSRLRTDV